MVSSCPSSEGIEVMAMQSSLFKFGMRVVKI
jgi:hypothetical protein